MKTNLETIANKLIKYNPLINISNKDSIFIDAIQYLDCNQKLFEPNILYLGKVSGFSQIPHFDYSFNILLIQDSDDILNHPSQKMLNMIILQNYPPLEVLYEEIGTLLKNAKQIMQKTMRLYDCLASDLGLKALVDLGAELLGNPIIVVDNGMKILAYSQNDRPNEQWNEHSKMGFYPYELTKKVKADGVMEIFMKGDMPVIFEDNDRKKQHLGWRLVIAGKIVGHIAVIDSYKPFEENDTEILCVLCNIVAIELQKNKNFWQTKGIVFDNLINDLLTGQLKNSELIKERLKYLDLKLNQYFLVLVAEYLIESAKNIPLPYIKELLEGTIFRARCAVYNDKLVTLLSRKGKNAFSEEEMLKLNKLLEENHMIAGLSRPFRDITRLKDYYAQSMTAIDLGLPLDNQKCIYFYEDYMEYHLIDMAAKNGEVKGICSPMISELIDYDQQNNSELVNSLFAYLSSGNNCAEAARKMGIHRNSMNYRIKKIEDILNIKVDAPHISFSLYLSLKILRFYERN